ncbi:MAG: HEAT repeat domain-containing protein [Cyanobacteria bacterium SZAS-4]|nr:HEAT repeat domain-containing protein [Cyanobacteria bacterium SZAS-4]
MEAATLNKELLEQYVLAGSSKTKPEQLRVLAEHFCDKIRLRVAENPATPPELLWNLAHDRNHDVRVAAGCNPSANESVLNLLVRDADIIVRHGMAQSIETPRLLLEILADDDNGWVRGEALKSLRILDSKVFDEVGNRRNRKRSRSRITTSDTESHEQVAS